MSLAIASAIASARGVVHAPTGAVAVEAVSPMEVLFEVVSEREVEERAAVSDELHARGEPALDDGELAGGEVAQCRVVDDLVAELTELTGRQATLLQTLAARAASLATGGAI
jgi:hypothetical protein